jgi:arylsulfatase
LVTTDDRDPNKWELYNLAKDRSETENMIEDHRDISLKLNAKWNKWAETSNVIPYPEQRNSLKKNPWPPPAWPGEYLKD